MSYRVLSLIVLALLTSQFISCSEKEPEINCATSDLVIGIVSLENTDCNTNNGSVELEAFGGSGGYRYRINGGLIQQSNIFPGLGEGGYIVTVVDSDNCTASEVLEIETKNDLLMNLTSENAGCGSSLGTISVAASGGDDLEYQINGGDFQPSNTFVDLLAGEYIIATRDSKSCIIQDTVRVLSGTSYLNEVSPIISANCAVSGCHDGQSGPPDWTNFDNVQNNADNIQARTTNRTMPPGGSGFELTDEQIELISCWVEDGAPNN